MKQINGCYTLYGNPIKRSHSRAVERWQKMFMKKFNYDPREQYVLGIEENPYLGPVFGLKNIVRADGMTAGTAGRHAVAAASPTTSAAEAGPGKTSPDELKNPHAMVISTIRMGFGHYRIAMAGASAAAAMGFTPYWLDLLTIPGITSDVINWCNTWYSRWSRISQRSSFFNTYVWEPVTTGEPTLPGLSAFLNSWIVGWPWRFLKTNIKDYKMSELFGLLHRALPSEIPILTAHMWNCMGAVAGGMTNVVDMMFDNWPMAFQLTEGAKHAVQSPSGYYGFRAMRGFDDRGKILRPLPAEAIHYTGHHVDHELVENIEADCAARLERMRHGEPRRFLVTMGGAGAQRELFHAIIQHCIPLIKEKKLTLFVNLGDHRDNWDWLSSQLSGYRDLIRTHFSWEDTKTYTDGIRENTAEGLHVFLHDNIFHAVYATNYLMRVVDVMITKPSELAFYPVPKIFNARVGGHEMWGAIRGAEIGDSTVETRTIPQTLQAIDLLTHGQDLLELYCSQIVKNKQIGIYDGAYKSVELATGKKFKR
ncbi:MAG: hypothetical protein SVR04_04270 [Spirochaetota bacterium]|nr:hypothetical protein [Spirochaetota bacterium]